MRQQKGFIVSMLVMSLFAFAAFMSGGCGGSSTTAGGGGCNR